MRHLLNLAFATSLVFVPTRALAAEFSAPQKAEVEQIVRDYLIAHPEILQEMAVLLDQKQKQAEATARESALTANASDIFKYDGDALVGNPKGDVTIVEFMDYNCGWCKKAVGEMTALVKADPNVRVVLKEFPIFGDGSEAAAQAALASKKQGKYWEFHQAMLSHEGQIARETVFEIAQSVGLDVEKLKTDMADPAVAATISKTKGLANVLQISGTPAFIVDTSVIPGYVSKDQLSEAVGAVRINGCKVC
jgi:protein-disulfide isomerase